MCGILGMIGSVPKGQQRLAHTILQNIFIFSKARGADASGFSAIHNRSDGRLITEKRAIDSLKFVDRSAKFKALAKDMPNIFIGHTRYSTSGTPKRGRNNHPFNSRKYSLVHNGGIYNWQTLVNRHDIKMRTETDSEILLHLVEREDSFHDGISHAMNIVGASSRVAVAMLKHDEDSPSLFLFRNLSNPVNVMTIPSMNAVFFASERAYLSSSIKSIWGNDAVAKAESLGINIEMLPSWKSFEWKLDDSGLPVISTEEEISKVYASHSAGFHGSSTVVNKTIGDSKTKLPMIGPSKSLDDKEAHEITTGDLIKNVSDETKSASIALSRVVRESTKVLKSIREESFMTNDEHEHFKKWMTIV